MLPRVLGTERRGLERAQLALGHALDPEVAAVRVAGPDVGGLDGGRLRARGRGSRPAQERDQRDAHGEAGGCDSRGKGGAGQMDGAAVQDHPT